MQAILTYHSLDESDSVISIRPDRFAKHIASLVNEGVKIVRLEDIRRVERAVAITIDDGFENFARYAVPVLERYAAPATLFVVSGYCGKRNDWLNVQYGSIPSLPLLSWAQLRALPRELVSIGSHSVTHVALGSVDTGRIKREIRESQKEIEQQLDRKVDAFAYPYGDITPEALNSVTNHYELACGTSLRYLGPSDSPLNLPRIDGYYLRRMEAIKLTSWRVTAYLQARGGLRRLNSLANTNKRLP